jgi:myosin-crossreactive antigen
MMDINYELRVMDDAVFELRNISAWVVDVYCKGKDKHDLYKLERVLEGIRERTKTIRHMAKKIRKHVIINQPHRKELS